MEPCLPVYRRITRRMPPPSFGRFSKLIFFSGRDTTPPRPIVEAPGFFDSGERANAERFTSWRRATIKTPPRPIVEAPGFFDSGESERRAIYFMEACNDKDSHFSAETSVFFFFLFILQRVGKHEA